MSLAEARQSREAAKKLLALGLDPSQQAKLDKITETTNASTFDALADEFLPKLEREGKGARTLQKQRWLLGLTRADLGGRPINEISAAECLVPLRRVEVRGRYESARRMRATIGQVFRYAIAEVRAENKKLPETELDARYRAAVDEILAEADRREGSAVQSASCPS